MMSKRNPALDGKRIALTPEVYAILGAEIKRIKEKGPHFKVNEASLANVLIEIFCLKFLDKERAHVEKRFFNKKLYLKSLIQKSSSEADLSQSLTEYIQMSKIRKKSNRKASGGLKEGDL